tara:strand:- start:610 stop:1011 length:402 start_codon:yes stop_codon:yes gene_type:complete
MPTRDTKEGTMFAKGGLAGPGRPKAAINRNKLVTEVLNKLNFEPLKEAVELYRHEDTPASIKSGLVLKMMRLVYPEVKQVQVESNTMSAASMVNPIAEAMIQIQGKKEGFDYNSRIDNVPKVRVTTEEASTSN